MKKFLAVVLAMALTLSLGACSLFAVTTTEDVGIIGGSDGPTQVIVGKEESSEPSAEPSADSTDTDETTEPQNPLVTIEMEDGSKIVIELYPDVAPNTVNNFISLVEQGFYDGVIFHRVIQSFMIQGGDPEGTGRGGPGYSIKGEFTNNGFANDLSHTTPGVISMARTTDPDSVGSQFFITTGPVEQTQHLDGDYAAFGKVIEGMDVVYRIEMVQTNSSVPVVEQKMQTVTVETFGVDYPDPEIIED